MPPDWEGIDWGGTSEEDRQDRYEQKVIAKLLRKIGWTAAEVKNTERELGPALNWEWFNEQGFATPVFTSSRIPNFSFIELLEKPTKSKITAALVEFCISGAEGCCMIFHVYDYGDWVATTIEQVGPATIVVRLPEITFYVVPFKRFMEQGWGQHEQ